MALEVEKLLHLLGEVPLRGALGVLDLADKALLTWVKSAISSWVGALLRVIEASCCEEYILCAEGGMYFVRRRAADGTHEEYEETARGPYMRACAVWVELCAGHVHRRRAAS